MEEYWKEQREEYRSKTVHRHDGFYLRFGFNAGYAWDTAEGSGIETKSQGAGGFVEYALGWNAGDHLVMAFAQHTFGVFSAKTTVGGSDLGGHHTAFYQVIGFLLDFYPDPTDGWHAALTIGPGYADVRRRQGESTNSGFGLGLGGGYDAWVGEQWSLGVGARVFYIANADDEFGHHRVFIPTLSFSALYH